MAGEFDESAVLEVLEKTRERVVNSVNVWFVIPFAEDAGLVCDDFVERLRVRKLTERLTDVQSMSIFLEKIVLQSGWFVKFLRVLEECHRYRPLAAQLSYEYHLVMAVRKGTSPVSDLLQQLVEKTTSFLEESKHKLEKTLGCQEYQSVVGAHSECRWQSEVTYDRRSKHEAEHSETHQDTGRDTMPNTDESSVQSSQGAPKTRGYSELHLAAHEVLRKNRGYLELKVPIEVIKSELYSQKVLSDYEYYELTSQPFPIKMNQCLLDALMRKSPEMFDRFCSILGNTPGYEYIAHYLQREVEGLDPAHSTGKLTPRSQYVDALVDKDLLDKSIQSIVDKQREMAEEVRKVHQMEVSQLRTAVSEARSSACDVKEEFDRLLKKKSVDSEHLSSLQGRIKEMVKFCEDVQARQEADNKNARETIFSVVDLHHRIGELTTQLERKGRETADWKGAAERLRAKLVDLEKRQTQQNSNYDEQITKSDARISNLQNQLSVSQSREGNLQQSFVAQEVKYADMEEQHQKERETLDERIFSLEFSERVRKQSLAALEVKCANMEEQHRKERESLIGIIRSLESNEKLLKHRDEDTEDDIRQREYLPSTDLNVIAAARENVTLQKRGPSKQHTIISTPSHSISSPLPQGVHEVDESELYLSMDDFVRNLPPRQKEDVSEEQWLPYNVEKELIQKQLQIWLKNRKEAEEALRAESKDGMFLFRSSSNAGTRLVLSIWKWGECRHFKVYEKGKLYSLDEHEWFEGLHNLVNHYQKKCLPSSTFCLTFPFM